MKAVIKFKDGTSRIEDLPTISERGSLYIPFRFMAATNDTQPRNVWVEQTVKSRFSPDARILEYEEVE